MVDWPEDKVFLKAYRMFSAEELAKSCGTHREAVYNHYNQLTKYRTVNKNGNIVTKERTFPYLNYLRLVLKGIRRETHSLGLNLNEKDFKAWLGTKKGQWLLRQFSAAREGGTQNDYEFGGTEGL